MALDFVVGLLVFIVSLEVVLILIGHLADDVLIQPLIIRQMGFEVNERDFGAAHTRTKCMTEITKKC